MNDDEWNNRLFIELVEQVGTPGDPLFLYVDDDVLAKCTDGQLGSDEAVADFCKAFNSVPCEARFASAARSARRWELGGFNGPPPFVDALAMTVLAATTRPPLGHEGIYARQRELLGIRDIGGGAPDGYVDYVPGLWKTWNRWLEGPGATFGRPTAAPGHYSYQGFARSQSFIRPRDKEDIYEYFEQGGMSPASIPSPSALLDGLALWLRSRPSRNPRLLARVNDDDYRDEFRAFLPSSLAFWKGEKKLAQKSYNLAGLLLWDPETDHLEIVVNLREVRGFTGEEVQLLNTETYTVSSDDSYLFLHDEATDEAVWFDDTIIAWPLHERLTVSWTPRSSYLFFEVAFFGWVEASGVEPGRRYRILTETDNVGDFEMLGVGGQVHVAKVSGWSWLVGTDLKTCSQESFNALEELLNLNEHSPRGPRASTLSDGLPLGSGNRYFEGGEPDIRIGIHDSFERVRVDGRDRLNELLPEVVSDQHRRVRLANLALDPGQHAVTVTTPVGESNHTFTVLAPQRSLGHWHLDESYQRLALSDNAASQVGFATYGLPMSSSASLVFRPGSCAYAISSSGESFVVSTNTTAPEWLELAGFDKEGETATFLETSEIYLPDQSQPFDLVYRRSSKSQWVVRTHPSGKPTDRFTATRTAPVEVLPPALLEFLFTDEILIDTDNRTGLPSLRKSILNARSAMVRPSVPLRAAPTPNRRAPQGQRFDLAAGPSKAANPFNDFLDWMSEQDAGYCSISKASLVFKWLWARSYPSLAQPDFTFEVLRRLLDLGHVHVDKAARRLWIAPTVLSTLPNAHSLRVQAGSRAIEFVAKLKSGDDETADAATSNLLQNMTFHELHQTDASGVPIGPDILYVQLASTDEIEDLSTSPLKTLGLDLQNNLSVRMIASLPPLRERIDGRTRTELPLKSRLHSWQSMNAATPRGRWSEIPRLPETGEHFLKVNTGFSTRYAWWHAEIGVLSPIDWAYGRWAFEATRPSAPILLHKAASRQLLVSALMPLPLTVSKALVARTGILPRRTTVRTAANAGDFNVFENVSIPFAGAIAEVLGQSKGPTLSTDVEFSFE